jgi:hypothetical protein
MLSSKNGLQKTCSGEILSFDQWLPEVGKVTLKINGDEALSDESL